MLEKIIGALGEELSKQVEEKLKAANIELAVMNDGSVVNAEKHDGLKAEYKTLEDKYSKDVLDVNTKLEEATKKAVDFDTLKGTLDDLKTENSKLAEQFENEKLMIKKNSASEVALIKSGLKEQYLDMAKSQLNINDLNFDGDNLLGLDKSIETLKENYSEMFGEMKRKGVDPKGGEMPPLGKKAQLVEQYNQAEKSGNAKLMFSLSNQIKQLK